MPQTNPAAGQRGGGGRIGQYVQPGNIVRSGACPSVTPKGQYRTHASITDDGLRRGPGDRHRRRQPPWPRASGAPPVGEPPNQPTPHRPMVIHNTRTFVASMVVTRTAEFLGLSVLTVSEEGENPKERYQTI